MKLLPPPGTFAEGQRLVYGLLAAGAGMFCGASAAAMVALLMWGGWSRDEEHTIVTIFGWSLGGLRPFSRHAVHPDGVLLSDPVDQLVELDRLLGRGQCVTGRKSVLTGGLSSDAGGSGKAGH